MMKSSWIFVKWLNNNYLNSILIKKIIFLFYMVSLFNCFERIIVYI
jgi:hypothetical protein